MTITDEQTSPFAKPRAASSVRQPLPGQRTSGIHDRTVGEDPFDQQTNAATKPKGSPSVGRPFPGHRTSDTQRELVGEGPSDQQTTFVPQPSERASVGRPLPDHGHTETQTSGVGEGYLELRIWAEMFHDAQQARIAATNRAERGGVDPDFYAAHVAGLEAVEHACGLALRRCFRRVAPPAVVAWQKQTLGIGEHLLARLLGHLGHPVHATPKHWVGTGPTHNQGRDEDHFHLVVGGHTNGTQPRAETHASRGSVDDGDPTRDQASVEDQKDRVVGGRHLVEGEPYDRTIAQLWAYCGHGDPNRKRRRGMDVDDALAGGSPHLKMLVHLVAESCMKHTGSPYRETYDKARVRYADRTHQEACVRCGPSGRPAQPGTPWSKGHQHAAALRLVGKTFLKDLWLVTAADHASSAAQKDPEHGS